MCAWAMQEKASNALFNSRPQAALSAALEGMGHAPAGHLIAVRLVAKAARAHAASGTRRSSSRRFGRRWMRTSACLPRRPPASGRTPARACLASRLPRGLRSLVIRLVRAGKRGPTVRGARPAADQRGAQMPSCWFVSSAHSRRGVITAHRWRTVLACSVCSSAGPPVLRRHPAILPPPRRCRARLGLTCPGTSGQRSAHAAVDG